MEAGAVTYDNDTSLDFTWETASGDVDHYNVYVSIDEGEYDLVGTTSETSYTVEGSDGHTYKIKVEAVDAAGNTGPMSDESDPVTVSLTSSYVNITVLLEGPYESDKTMKTELNIPALSPYADAKKAKTVPENAVDWVYVEILKEKEKKKDKKEKEKVKGESMFLLSDGSIVDRKGSTKANFYNLPKGNYYLVIRHRNHLPIMSKFPVSLVESGDSLVDLTVKDNVYTTGGPNAVKELEPGTYGMYAGDTNCSNGVNSADYLVVKVESGSSGYYAGDCNMSGVVNAADYMVIKLNSGKNSQVP